MKSNEYTLIRAFINKTKGDPDKGKKLLIVEEEHNASCWSGAVAKLQLVINAPPEHNMDGE